MALRIVVRRGRAFASRGQAVAVTALLAISLYAVASAVIRQSVRTRPSTAVIIAQATPPPPVPAVEPASASRTLTPIPPLQNEPNPPAPAPAGQNEPKPPTPFGPVVQNEPKPLPAAAKPRVQNEPKSAPVGPAPAPRQNEPKPPAVPAVQNEPEPALPGLILRFPVPVARDHDEFAPYRDGFARDDESTTRLLIQEGLLFSLPAGTAVEILDERDGLALIREKSGTRSGWVRRGAVRSTR